MIKDLTGQTIAVGSVFLDRKASPKAFEIFASAGATYRSDNDDSLLQRARIRSGSLNTTTFTSIALKDHQAFSTGLGVSFLGCKRVPCIHVLLSARLPEVPYRYGCTVSVGEAANSRSWDLYAGFMDVSGDRPVFEFVKCLNGNPSAPQTQPNLYYFEIVTHEVIGKYPGIPQLQDHLGCVWMQCGSNNGIAFLSIDGMGRFSFFK